MEEKYASDDLVREIRDGAGKIERPIHQLRGWIQKVAEVSRSSDRTDASAMEAGRNKKVTKEALARLFNRSTGWMRQCLEADKLIDDKADANDTVIQYMTTESCVEFGVASFLLFLQNQ